MNRDPVPVFFVICNFLILNFHFVRIKGVGGSVVPAAQPCMTKQLACAARRAIRFFFGGSGPRRLNMRRYTVQALSACSSVP